MLWEHDLQASVSTEFFKCFYNSIETRRTCFLSLLENTMKKGKLLVYIDSQNLNSLCSGHHHANTLCKLCVSIKL